MNTNEQNDDAQARDNDDDAFCILKNETTGDYIWYYEKDDSKLIRKFSIKNNTKCSMHHIRAGVSVFRQWLLVDKQNGYTIIKGDIFMPISYPIIEDPQMEVVVDDYGNPIRKSRRI